MAVRMRAPEQLVVELEHEIVRRVVHHPDLLEYDLPLEQQILSSQERSEQQIADHVGGLDEMFVEDARLIRCVLARRVCVERAAQHLERQRNLARRAMLRSLEHHVLEQMRHSHPLARLMDGCRANPGAESNRPHTRHVLREYGQSIRKLSAAQPGVGRRRDDGHLRDRPPRPDPPPRRPRSSPPDDGASVLSPGATPLATATAPLSSRRGPREPFESSDVPSGFGTSAFIDRRRRPRSSRSMSFTRTRSPFLTTSSVLSVRPCASSEMCTSPSVPGKISTNAPNAVVLLTVPSYSAPISGSTVRALII